jgi:hypothetical protein
MPTTQNKKGSNIKHNFAPTTKRPMDNQILGKSNGCNEKQTNFF